MSKQVEILRILADTLPYETRLSQALDLAKRIEAVFVFDADAWCDEHYSEFVEGGFLRKISMIKGVRDASANHSGALLSLLEAKLATERAEARNGNPWQPKANSYEDDYGFDADPPF